jgi:hypothetical protein
MKESTTLAALRGSFSLAGNRTPELQRFTTETRIMMHAPDGSITATDVYRLSLLCTPSAIAGTAGDRHTCEGFSVQLGGAAERGIPSLEGWSYELTTRPFERQPDGRTLGIPHEPFDSLEDSEGTVLPPGNAYHVYNAFIDFHSFFIFTDRTPKSGGIQDLARPGQKVVHPASFSRPSTNLGSQVDEGSYFMNGEITIELKGVGVVDDAECAIVGYDSGRSSFRMEITAAPGLQVKTAGSSHYMGDIYKDLVTNWVRKATLTELVVSETTIPGQPQTVKGVIERSILALNVTG